MFQRAGKEHIRYIKEMAEKEWCDCNFKTPFDTCLIHAMEKHKRYIIQIESAALEFARSGRSAIKNSALND